MLTIVLCLLMDKIIILALTIGPSVTEPTYKHQMLIVKNLYLFNTKKIQIEAPN